MAGDFIPFAPEPMMWRINRERGCPPYRASCGSPAGGVSTGGKWDSPWKGGWGSL